MHVSSVLLHVTPEHGSTLTKDEDADAADDADDDADDVLNADDGLRTKLRIDENEIEDDDDGLMA